MFLDRWRTGESLQVYQAGRLRATATPAAS